MELLKRISVDANLGSERLDFLRTYSGAQLQRTELGLEREIRRESYVPPRTRRIARLRHRGEMILHSKHVLLAIVILNLVDCCLVLGELVLDIHYIKEIREDTDATSKKFIETMESRYPRHIYDFHVDEIAHVYEQLYHADCTWPEDASDVSVVTLENTTLPEEKPTNKTHIGRLLKRSDNPSAHLLNAIPGAVYARKVYPLHREHDESAHSVLEDIAHGLHKASVVILGVLFVENLLKLVCMGSEFFAKKLEVFDTIVVIVSFVVDLVLLKGLTEFAVQDALFILSFLLPWRVIRVVNSLIVAVLDHEHFRLKMLYRATKLLDIELSGLKDMEKKWDFHLQKIESFCESEGIPKWKIRQHTALGRKQSTITSMASLALSGILPGIVIGASDKKMLDKKIERSTSTGTQNNAEKAHITNPRMTVIEESDDDSDDVTIDVGGDVSKNVEDTKLCLDSSTTNTMTPRASEQADSGRPVSPTLMKVELPSKMKRVSFDAREAVPLLPRGSVDILETVKRIQIKNVKS
ncbi:uncharacterized protein LOC128231488 isoform X2 [Mya arenaria]|uniref:uncharacterized protein LOC128231488 isoform X2 n=1 Tax=Mya arenaria TaxID=6604 RepID=UPI0022E97AF8|nr:uncharacterized protein LOC128231488 isoform X2 [Mya arenaria]